MNRYQQLLQLLTSHEEDFIKFYEKGVQAAGTRVRKAMQEMKNLAQEIRNEIQKMKNAAEAQKSNAQESSF
ncbi:MAG: histone H1 [Cytophagales bacterium]|nr:histone H1 [Cytophagales bacterium]MDW8385034.1 histone H1 [Flammeovirgaceae bacterium]